MNLLSLVKSAPVIAAFILIALLMITRADNDRLKEEVAGMQVTIEAQSTRFMEMDKALLKSADSWGEERERISKLEVKHTAAQKQYRDLLIKYRKAAVKPTTAENPREEKITPESLSVAATDTYNGIVQEYWQVESRTVTYPDGRTVVTDGGMQLLSPDVPLTSQH